MGIYGRECIGCEKLFDCKGKDKDKPCLNYQERKKKEEKRDV